MCYKILKIYLLVGIALSFSLVFEAFGAEAIKLYIPSLKAKAGQSFDVPITIDNVENLAGIKLVIEYDSNILKYESETKADQASAMMHVVNDKKPGKLIVVMAGAKGINGKDLAILTLRFKAEENAAGKDKDCIKIAEAQLMDDKLVDLKVEIVQNPIIIEP